MKEQEPIQLNDNIMFALEEAGVLEEYETALSKIEEVTEYLKRAILASNPDTRLYFIDDRTTQKNDIALSDLALDEKGLPLISSAIAIAPYNGDLMEYVFFGWKTKDGQEYSASYPHMAFYLPD